MKNRLVILSFLLGLASLSLAQTAQIALVKPNGTTYIYTKFDSAYVHAANGDFIYLPGDYFTVASPINKSIHIYGAGYNQDSSASTGITTLDGLIVFNGAEGGSIEGLKINNNNGCSAGSVRFGNTSNTNPISGYTITNCNLVGGITFTSESSNITIRNNLIGGHTCGSVWVSIDGLLTNSLISNNIISADFGTSGTPNLIISNNLFAWASPSYPGDLAHYSIYENNIFQATTWYGSYSTFNNNSNASINGSENIFTNQLSETWNLTFINPGTPGGNGYYTYDVHNDYHVKTTSGCHNSGTDGSDRGIYGGIFPWTDGSIPLNPHIYFKDIDPVTGPDGKLHIEVGVRTNN